MKNKNLLVDKDRVKILREQAEDYKNSEDFFVRGLGEGIRITLEFLMRGKADERTETVHL